MRDHKIVISITILHFPKFHTKTNIRFYSPQGQRMDWHKIYRYHKDYWAERLWSCFQPDFFVHSQTNIVENLLLLGQFDLCRQDDSGNSHLVLFYCGCTFKIWMKESWKQQSFTCVDKLTHVPLCSIENKQKLLQRQYNIDATGGDMNVK